MGGMVVTEAHAIEIAKAFAERQRLPWEPPIHVKREESQRLGAAVWSVWTNADALGCNLGVVIDEMTGEVLEWDWNPE